MLHFYSFLLCSADILRANDELATVIADYRRIVVGPGGSATPSTTPSSKPSTAESHPSKDADSSSNLSSLIDLDMSAGGNTQAATSDTGNLLSYDLQDLGRNVGRLYS